jgi:hypothetical protein
MARGNLFHRPERDARIAVGDTGRRAAVHIVVDDRRLVRE